MSIQTRRATEPKAMTVLKICLKAMLRSEGSGKKGLAIVRAMRYSMSEKNKQTATG